MALKKSELYSSLWSSCDALRGGMDASQYKDYVLVMLFIKYVSDKYANLPFAAVNVPKGSSFTDMVALKGTPNIGDDINKKIIGPIAAANKLSEMPDFNDDAKLGSGKEKVERLTDLISIFENKSLDFSKNRADGDDILGDAYEYLMRHFATESGKSKGQFYTPAEVSSVISKIIGINKSNSTAATKAYDPTCGSGSLLLKVAHEAETAITLYGQEKDTPTSVLARMNMTLHDCPTAVIEPGNTLSNPKFLSANGTLDTFDYVVANPPFSDKRWHTGLTPATDPFGRFQEFGIPPAKNGDFAYLLHIIRSLKSRGKGACILPHGVLFRGNAEAEIRKNIIRKGLIKGIISLPPNLFYGTGIPACIIVIDKENAESRKGIFMIDASKGFIKDGNKNRLRDMDVHKIVDVFNKQLTVDNKYARMVTLDEIEQNEFNLNIPRYIDSTTPEDLQDIEAHLLGDIPVADIDDLSDYWQIYPTLKATLFGKCATDRRNAEHYAQLLVSKEAIKSTIFQHPEFISYTTSMAQVFETWRHTNAETLKGLQVGFKPKTLIHALSEGLLQHYTDKALVDKYHIYQHIMSYWADTMQDDAYMIAADGWIATTYRVLVENSKKVKVDKGWTCDLMPKALVINRYFAAEQQAIQTLEADIANTEAQITELIEDNSEEDSAFADLDKISKVTVTKGLKALKLLKLELPISKSTLDDISAEMKLLEAYLALTDKQKTQTDQLKKLEAALDQKLYAKYPALTEAEIKILVVDDKWMANIKQRMDGEIDQISQRLTQRIKELAGRYETALPKQLVNLEIQMQKVNAHLSKMGFIWQ